MCLEKDNLLFTPIPQHYGITKIKKLHLQTFQRKQGACLISAMKMVVEQSKMLVFISEQKLLSRPFQRCKERLLKTADPGNSPDHFVLESESPAIFFFFLSKVPKWFLGILKFVSQSMWCRRDRATLRSLKEHQAFSKRILCMTFFFLHTREVERWVVVTYLFPPGFNRQRLGSCVHLVWYSNQGINKFCQVGSCSAWFMGS